MSIKKIIDNLNEASMNISMNGADANEISDLISLLKNAGINTHVDMPMAHDAMHTDIDSHNEPSCDMGEEADVDEEYENEPEEEYQSTQYMTHDLAGGYNREKDRKAIRVKDPAIESIMSELAVALSEKLK